MSVNPNFIIYAPPYKEDSGGIIALHKLCHILNEMGYQAFLWPNQFGVRPNLRKKLRVFLKKKPYATFPGFTSPLASKSTLNEKSIIIYSEVDYGNPLGGNNVVRWLLHKPGFHTGVANFGKNELIFFFVDYFIEKNFDIAPENRLFVLSLNPCYTSEGAGHRSGSCYIMRKGKGRKIIHDLTDSVLIDGMSHQETANMFRTKEIFYSYDEMTLYSQYAALCGCISVVIPDKYENRQQWVEKQPVAKFGIAYGLDDIEHSIKTMHKVADYFNELERESRETVARFAKVSIAHFNM